MTPEQRAHLSKLIDESRYAMLERGLALHAGKDAHDRAAERTSETFRAVMEYLDEVTDLLEGRGSLAAEPDRGDHGAGGKSHTSHREGRVMADHTSAMAALARTATHEREADDA